MSVDWVGFAQANVKEAEALRRDPLIWHQRNRRHFVADRAGAFYRCLGHGCPTGCCSPLRWMGKPVEEAERIKHER